MKKERMNFSKLILSFGVILFSCESYPTEKYYYHDDGSLKAKIITFNSEGRRNAYNYYPNGNINFIHYYHNYDNDGITEWYDSLGRIRSRHEVKTSLNNGISKFYYPSGNLQAIAETENNKQHGWSKVYFDEADTIRKQLIYFHQDSVMYDISYNNSGQPSNSFLTYSIDKINESEDSVSLEFQLVVSRYFKVAVSLGDWEKREDELRTWFDNDSIVRTTIAKNKERKIEGLVHEVESFSKVEDPEDSVVAFKYAASFPFKYEY